MKLEPIARLCAVHHRINIINLPDGRQWIGNGPGIDGAALFPVDGDMPEINRENVFALFNISEDNRQFYRVEEFNANPGNVGITERMFSDSFDDEPVQEEKIKSIEYYGEILQMAWTSHGIEYFTSESIKPCKKRLDYLVERETSCGFVLAAKEGAMLCGLIWPRKIDREVLRAELERYLQEEKRGAAHNKEPKADNGQLSFDFEN